jgi:hypothetical protein
VCVWSVHDLWAMGHGPWTVRWQGGRETPGNPMFWYIPCLNCPPPLPAQRQCLQNITTVRLSFALLSALGLGALAAQVYVRAPSLAAAWCRLPPPFMHVEDVVWTRPTHAHAFHRAQARP